MTERTERMIRDIFACDETLGDDAAARVIELLKSGTAITVPISKIWSREEVANALHKSLKAVDWYAKRGFLVRVNPTGSRRSIGFTDRSVRALAEGKVNANV